MNLTLFKLEFRRQLKGFLVWSLSLGLTLFLIIMVYPIVQDMMDALEDMLLYLESIDSSFLGFLETFGGIPENGIEYFATEGALFLQLLGGIYAAILGFNIIQKDEKEETVEVLHVLPMSRSMILSTKMMYVLVTIFLFTAIQIGFVHLGFLFVSPNESMVELWTFGFFDFIMFLMISYLAMGLALLLKPKTSPLVSIAIPFPFYVLTMIAFATNNDILKALKYISPFTFTEPVGWLKDHVPFEWENFLIYVGITLIVIILSFVFYRKREMI